jgi:hypothetical protein
MKLLLSPLFLNTLNSPSNNGPKTKEKKKRKGKKKKDSRCRHWAQRRKELIARKNQKM